MSTNPPTMTTEQLIAACAREHVQVSVTQLARWVRAGLIPASLRKRRGRGRGKGAEWVWKWECLPRAVIIAGALARGDPSLDRAAQALAAAGFAPSAEHVRRILLGRLDAFERRLTRRQGYLTDDRPTPAKRKQLVKNLRRKAANAPDWLMHSVETLASAHHGLITQDDPDAGGGAGTYSRAFSFSAMRQRLIDLDDGTLLAKYEQAGRELPSFLSNYIASMKILLNTILTALVDPVDAEEAYILEKLVDSLLLLGLDRQELSASMLVTPERVITLPGTPAGALAGGIRLFSATMLAVDPFTTLPPDVAEFATQFFRQIAEHSGVDLSNGTAVDDQYPVADAEEVQSQSTT